MRLRDLPSVDELARQSDDPLAVEAARKVVARARELIQAGDNPGDLAARLQAELSAARTPHLRRVINATGVIVHTNLGRAPLAEAALERVHEIARGYSNLEYDLAAGGRGSRQDHVAGILRRLTGAERRPRSPGVTGRVDRDRRRLPHPGRAREIGRAPTRGRDDEPHARRRLRNCDRPGDGSAFARAPVDLPRRGLHCAGFAARVG